MYNLRTTSGFDKDLKKLDRSIAKRILNKLDYLAKNPKLAEPLEYLPKDLEGLKKFRVGDWRVLFWVDDNKKEIILYGVDHRGSIYKRFS